MSVTLLCLHGWGGSKESFTQLREALTGAHLEILTPDLPGFGESTDPPKPWTVDDYALWVETWLSAHRKQKGKLFILGHSHGGRIAIKMMHRGNVKPDHLFLCAAAGIRRKKHLKRIIGLMLAKTGKTLLNIPGMRTLQPLGKKLLYKLVRVHDYEKANEVMRQTLILVSKEDLRPELQYISCPTDIFWGKQDGMTPIADAHIMHNNIDGSFLHTFPDVRHAVHRDKASEIAKVILEKQ